MQALSRELEHALEAFFVSYEHQQQGTTPTRTIAGASSAPAQHAGASVSSSLVASSISSSCISQQQQQHPYGAVNNNSNSHSHQVRRAARRLERSLTQMELFWFQEQASTISISDHATTRLDQDLLQDVTTPFLVKLLTCNDVLALQQASTSALRLLSLVVLEDDSHVDALLDRLGYELMTTTTSSYSPFLMGLMQLLDRHLHERAAVAGTSMLLLLPLLAARDAQALVSFCVTKCVNDLVGMQQQQNDHAAGCLALRSLLVHFLRHVVHLAPANQEQERDGAPTMRDWWMQQLLMENQQHGAADEHAITAMIRAETNKFFRQLETLGQETLESVLDILVDSNTTGTSLETILAYSTAALELAHVLENDFDLHGSFDTTKQSLLVSLTETIVASSSSRQQPNADPGMVPAALELLVSLAKEVLSTGTSSACHDNGVQKAVTMILFLSLNTSHCDGMTEDLELLWMATTGNASTQPNGDDSLPLSLLLTTLLLPTSAGSNWKESAARLIVATGEHQQTQSRSSPWHHIVSRKIAPSGGGSAGGVDGILKEYAAKYALPPVAVATHQQAKTANATSAGAPRN